MPKPYRDVGRPLLGARARDLPRRTRGPVVTALFSLALLSASPAMAVGGLRSARSTAGPIAHTSRTVYLREYGHLRYVGGDESSLSEQGGAGGTFAGRVTASLTISAEHVSAVFHLYPRGGSVTGRAYARFIIRGHTGYYGGTLKILHGTGAYRHASGTNIGISGTIDRYSFALTVKANGWIRY